MIAISNKNWNGVQKYYLSYLKKYKNNITQNKNKQKNKMNIIKFFGTNAFLQTLYPGIHDASLVIVENIHVKIIHKPC